MSLIRQGIDFIMQFCEISLYKILSFKDYFWQVISM
jgi:hypothetical protein